MPMTRSRGKPVTCLVHPAHDVQGIRYHNNDGLGQFCLICWETCLTMSALVRTRSSRLIPGLRAMPAVTTTRSDPAAGL